MVGIANTLSAVEVYKVIRRIGVAHGDHQINDFVIGTAICLRESGGPPFLQVKTNARNINTDGSIDRGMWQINDKAHSNVTDAQCDDPTAATEAAFTISNGFQNWSAWEKNGKLILASLPAAALAARSIGDIATANGGTVPDTNPTIISEIPVVGGVIQGSIDAVTSIPDILKQALKMLTNTSFWLKILIGLGGLFLIGFSLTLIFNKQATEVAKVGAVA